MGCYVIRKGAKKKDGSFGHWYVVFENGFRIENGKQKKNQSTVVKEELLKLGFDWSWPTDRAKVHAHQLNKGNHNKAWTIRRLEEQKRLRDEKKDLDAHLPEFHLAPFEKELEANPNYVKAEVPMHWRYAKRIIVSNQLDPFTWSTPMNSDKIYLYFAEKKVSLSYVQKVIRAMNMWGEYLGEQEKKFFKPLKMPTGHKRQRIRDAQRNSGKRTNESLPLTPDLLKQMSGKVRDDNYNWMYLSFWLGLRPEEVDSLNPNPWIAH